MSERDATALLPGCNGVAPDVTRDELDLAVKAADYASFEQRRKGAAKRGKLRGIGIATYIEACAMAPSERQA